MSIEYRLGKTETGYPQISCNDPAAIVEHLNIYGFGDCISFYKKAGDNAKFGSGWGIRNLRCFEEMGLFERLMDMKDADLQKLAVRMYELLYTKRNKSPNYYAVPPEIDQKDPRFTNILEELIALWKTEKRLVESKQLVFPKISQKELECIDIW